MVKASTVWHANEVRQQFGIAGVSVICVRPLCITKRCVWRVGVGFLRANKQIKCGRPFLLRQKVGKYRRQAFNCVLLTVLVHYQSLSKVRRLSSRPKIFSSNWKEQHGKEQQRKKQYRKKEHRKEQHRKEQHRMELVLINCTRKKFTF